MLFSSTVFLFLFLPIVLVIYYGLLKKRTARNKFLFAVSLIFYAWGEVKFVLLMVICIVINYIGGLLIAHYKDRKKLRKWFLAGVVIGNLSLLGWFKYSGFVVKNINYILRTTLNVPNIVLPIGISFFIFQGLSYVLDVYMEKAKVQKNLLNVGLYVAFFPQLVAGPIVRYQTIAEQIDLREETEAFFAEGVARFVKGLAKKVLLANQFGLIADKAFSMPADHIAVGFAWLGAIGYMLQIYYDFSGYSDMAIGLGKMFGFHFEENFNAPYLAKSVSDFWRRWHISLGTWFRDYVYFPLGGSRVASKTRLVYNLFIVWFLTGLWHGANWTFISWGLYFFLLIAIEKLFNLEAFLKKSKVIGHVYLLLTVLVGWVMFKSESIYYAFDYFKSMMGLNSKILLGGLGKLYWTENVLIIMIGILGCLPISKWLHSFKWMKENKYTGLRQFSSIVLGIGLMAIAVSYLVKNSYNPFIYFNF